jgi:hypothetical protein
VTTVCPNGHQSATADYCDQCGAKIGGAAAPTADPPVPADALPVPADAPAAEPPAAAPPSAEPVLDEASGQPCPVCGAARVGADRYCEGCGYDFAVAGAPAGATVSGSSAGAAWEAIVTADRDYFDRVAPEGVNFPPHCPQRTFVVGGDEVRIGRRSASRGIQPEIDLCGAPEDTAISHLHALLVRQLDGSYSLVDPGSTNGTTVNDDETPIAANVPIPLADGDRIHIGAWTTIRLHARSGQ